MGVVDGTVGGAGSGLLGVGLGAALGAVLMGWGAVPVRSVGAITVFFWICQAMVSPSDATTVAASNAITSIQRRVRRPRTSSTWSTGSAGGWPAAVDSVSESAASASIAVAEAVSSISPRVRSRSHAGAGMNTGVAHRGGGSVAACCVRQRGAQLPHALQNDIRTPVELSSANGAASERLTMIDESSCGAGCPSVDIDITLKFGS
jgi:hypothetical protein